MQSPTSLTPAYSRITDPVLAPSSPLRSSEIALANGSVSRTDSAARANSAC